MFGAVVIRGFVIETRKISEKCWEVDLELPQRRTANDKPSPPEFAVVRLVSAALMAGPVLKAGHDVVLQCRIGGGRSQDGKCFNGLVAFEYPIFPSR